MASTASSSEASASNMSTRAVLADGSPEQTQTEQTQMEHRPQAGPLPAKAPRLVGEIGYPEHLQDVDLGDGPDLDTDSAEGLTAAEADARNGRHPADRSHVNLASQSTMSLPLPPTASNGQPLPPRSDSSASSLNTTSKHSIFSFHSLSSRLATKTYGGISLTTFTRLGLLVLGLSGLSVAWIFAAMHISRSSSSSSTTAPNGGTTSIFVHVAFAIMLLIGLIFTERAVFQLRAERYAHVHPGEILPSSRHRMGTPMPTHYSGSNGMAFAPWNRPPLPTYAAALGVRGTGDVEDTIIAAPPPPAYGNTRGSTLIFANLLRNSRASNRSRASAQGGNAPWQIVGRPGSDGRMSGVSTHSMPPISYDEVEVQSDAERARILEETLATLEEGGNTRVP